MHIWQRLQGLPFEVQAPLAVTVLLALGAFAQWAITEARQGRRHREDQRRQEQKERDAREEQARRDHHEQERRHRQEQAEIFAKQADFSFTRFPDEPPVGVDCSGTDRMLVGQIFSVGIADAARVNIRAYLNGTELPRSGSWPLDEPLPVGGWLHYEFALPFKVEPPEQQHGPRLDEDLGNSVVRFDVRFNDASAANRALSYCFRFDHAPLPERWPTRQVECLADPGTEQPYSVSHHT